MIQQYNCKEKLDAGHSQDFKDFNLKLINLINLVFKNTKVVDY